MIDISVLRKTIMNNVGNAKCNVDQLILYILIVISEYDKLADKS